MRPSKKLSFLFLGAGLVLLVTVGILFLVPAQAVSAQCGSQASSCKNCHETQAKDPVNNDGTAWHTSHAFGDFCYLCHGGNNQATDETTAHAGMVNPLADVMTSCKSCHASDYQAKAQIYATTLGIKIGTGTNSSAPTPAAASGTPAAPVASAPAVAAAVPASSVPAGTLVDYTQRYNESVLGEQPLNVGNLILIAMIAAMLFGGGYFILRREGWVAVSFQETKQIQESYPADVVEMVPELTKLNPTARQNLRQILSKPATAAELFALVNKLAGKEDSSKPEQENDKSD
ncbi:MAG: hypothetical protein WCE68_00120 [Anaerolineales bacterium]